MTAPAPSADGTARAAATLRAGACTDVGAVRTENQDCYAALPARAVPKSRADRPADPVAEPALFVVADGMGGHEAGGEASASAVAALLAHVADGSAAGGGAVAMLASAVHAANAAVWARATLDGHLRRMGTTCTVLRISGGRAVLGHVGDSRAYRIRDGRLEQLTTDHTVAEAARLRPDLHAAAHARRHHLTRALGVQESVEVDALDVGAVQPGDRFVLCSDGLEPVPAEEMLRAVLSYPAQEAAEWLVALASARGSRDNATAVVVHVLP